ncbi:hypothetical protein C8J56DRAFT_937904 [Mycena floridula]|nr:hypothetical protein C8J56DRAFT_937904 [Mycena floridula]
MNSTSRAQGLAPRSSGKQHMTATISDATRAWQLGVHWSLYSQCGVWNPVSRGVDIYECVRDHDAIPGTQPPNSFYWRYLTRR